MRDFGDEVNDEFCCGISKIINKGIVKNSIDFFINILRLLRKIMGFLKKKG